MMRCISCNTLLTDEESTHKDEVTGEYLDTCFDCLEDDEPSDEGPFDTIEELIEVLEKES